MASINASASGTFKIGGDLEVNRLGFGAMRITGKGIWGEPANPKAARETLAKLPELGVNLIDTADSYGPYVSDGVTHATLPKSADPKSVTLDQAIVLIAEKAAKGPSKGKRKAPARKKAAS